MGINIDQIIEINKKHGGCLLNKSNLEFDIERANEEKNIWRSNAYLVRGIVSGHCFLDGCKSTAMEVITDRFAEHKIGCDKSKLVRGILKIARGEIQDINKIEKGLRKWCYKL